MFLTDREIFDLIKSGDIMDVEPLLADPLSKDSRIQPCSLDLRVGEIFVPGSQLDQSGGANKPKIEQHSLKPGETAVVTTKEKFNLPNNIAGFGFPPARVSRYGILMTDPGHIDPGYQGALNFTLVNMGKEPYAILPGQEICSVLLFKLQRPPERDYRSRGPYPTTDRQNLLQRLSLDFLDVDKRAEKAAQERVKEAELRLKNWQVWVPLLVGVLALIGTLASIMVNVFVFRSDTNDDIAQIEAQLTDLAPTKQQVGKIQQQLQFEERLSSLESQIKAIIESDQEQRSP